ncbi:RNA polymerase subunit sigma-70 [Alteromonadaceae bacterium M269]|nr:RNA polymerase subunit sigma-70 [Alteromonadaceae bacterium M269]
MANDSIEHVFRHEYGRLVALLVSRFGIQTIEAIEDAVQYSMEQALFHWAKDEQPQNPAAWLYKVAIRQLMSELKGSQRRKQLLHEHDVQDGSGRDESDSLESNSHLACELDDAFLSMLFHACDKSIPSESQLVFTLKSLCGFSNTEIARRLFITEANTYKRYNRAKHYLQANISRELSLTASAMQERLPDVLNVLYLLFTEGYLSSHEDFAIRQDLCNEAIRLGMALTQNQIGQEPQSFALVALMLLNSARLEARAEGGELALLDGQDRASWDQQKIHLGLSFLQQSAQGDSISRYHLEASIAAEHCLSPSFEQTNWERIVTSYGQLEKLTASPLHKLNKAVAMSHWKGAKEAIAILKNEDMPDWLLRSYHWHAVLADLQYQIGEHNDALVNADKAMNLAPSSHIKALLKARYSRY